MITVTGYNSTCLQAASPLAGLTFAGKVVLTFTSECEHDKAKSSTLTTASQLGLDGGRFRNQVSSPTASPTAIMAMIAHHI
jgi:hypothetical protein